MKTAIHLIFYGKRFRYGVFSAGLSACSRNGMISKKTLSVSLAVSLYEVWKVEGRREGCDVGRAEHPQAIYFENS